MTFAERIRMMNKTNAFSKNSKKEMRQGNFINPVTLNVDDLLKIERKERD
ncbi:unnamed protein product, partial [marine sediment metagenome]